MEHIRQFDWCSSGPDTNFLNEDEIDNCAVERIIRNKFRDPMISSDSEDEVPKQKIDWNQVFKRNDNEEDNRHTVYVAGMRTVPPYPKLSSLTTQQHYQCLKVLCAKNPKVLATAFVAYPKKYDYNVFERVKEAYLNEQKEYIEWAKTLWSTQHNVRALRPKPTTENVYEAEFKMRESSLQSFPKNFEMVAHISLSNIKNRCEMVHKQDLVNVNVADLPKVEIPDPFIRKLILRTCPVPEPCNKHPCWFILPNEKDMTVLPLTEIHRELAQFALDNDTLIVTSEGALKCLVEMDREWTIPLTVCEAISLDGDKRNVLVIGSEFSTNRKSAMERTYRAFRHMLGYALIPLSEKTKLQSRENHLEVASGSGAAGAAEQNETTFDMDVSSDDDDDGHLVINDDIDDEAAVASDDEEESEPVQIEETQNNNNNNHNEEHNPAEIETTENTSSENQSDDAKKKDSDGFYSCSCKDSVMFENPPLRSFRKWQVKNYKNGDIFDMIVHCSHKMKGKTGEIILEPIVEYQIDLGGSKQSDDKMKSLALSLFLRKNASLLNVRVDGTSAEVVTMNALSLDDLTNKQSDVMAEVSNIVHETLNQMLSLLPGHYILHHEVSHGANALLYASKIMGNGQKLCLNFDCAVLAEADEAKSLKNAPALTDVLLPVHKHRKILPCAFSPFERMVAKQSKKPPTKTRVPPQALQWPKRKKKKRRTNA